MEKITLKKNTPQGHTLEATFLPEKGMNLISYKLNEIEVIDQSTWNLFEERFAGLGALIGPHFHRRKKETLPKIADESLFPFISRIRDKGIDDPFSHGIARYAPWKAECTEDSINASLSGKDGWNGVPLSALEGQNFKMEMRVKLKENGLFLELSVVSDASSLVGIHYYYSLPQGEGTIISQVRHQVRLNGKLQPHSNEFSFDEQQNMILDLNRDIDATFRPFPNPLVGDILLKTATYSLRTRYECPCEENAWQLYHPKDASFVCIEPVSAQDPRHPNLTVSQLKIHLEITPNGH